MVESDDGPPIVGLPERFDRRLRLGPFPSAHDALKFVTYAAIGALLSPFTSAWVWLPVVLAGFAVSVWRPDGQAVDERALAFVAWKLRTVGPRVVMKTRSPRPLVRQGLLQIAPHQYVAVLRTGGTPVAYLPPEELARRFELYRELLRSTDASFSLLVTTTPMHSQAVRPVTAPEDVRETTAFTGYSELVSVLCRRRFLRRVYFALVTLEADSDAVGRLEGRAANLMERLGALGLRPTRLRDRALAEAARRFGWTVEGAEE
jgi:hypothetical protein